MMHRCCSLSTLYMHLRLLWLVSEWSRAKPQPHHPLHLRLHRAPVAVTANVAASCWFYRWAFLHFRLPAGDVNEGVPRRTQPQRWPKHPKHVIVELLLSSKLTASLNEAELWVQAESNTGRRALFFSGLDDAAAFCLGVNSLWFVKKTQKKRKRRKELTHQ